MKCRSSAARRTRVGRGGGSRERTARRRRLRGPWINSGAGPSALPAPAPAAAVSSQQRPETPVAARLRPRRWDSSEDDITQFFESRAIYMSMVSGLDATARSLDTVISDSERTKCFSRTRPKHDEVAGAA
ncbi:hypothetical protein EVAR_77778_1 [Eumeta japonica]|uniref:Uncharacterized protein n=1 Tax=Eumeta variegata TaxID=151549 RepID=A0A4C1TBZ2_EUMVA|nr:hypothetical protein EVAR_77778_1 [Eumeta japonica]